MRIAGILLIFVFFAFNVSALYECSNNSLLIKDQSEIDLGKTKNINGLQIGLIKSFDSPALRKYESELIIDAIRFQISNETSPLEFSLKKGSYTLSLLNSSDKDAKLKIDSSSSILEVGSFENIGGLILFLENTSGVYPDNAIVSGIVGSKKIILNNENPYKVETISGVEYLVGLTTASDKNAIVSIEKCDKNSSKIVQIENIQNNNSLSNNTQQTNKSTSEANESNLVTNDSNIIQNISNISKTNIEKNSFLSESYKFIQNRNYLLIGVFINTIIIVFLLIVYYKIRKNNRPDNNNKI
ncbi:MAG: hypothetical protein QXI33_03230 [Candidatus Pacearchaeota archaeon]